MNKKKKGWKGKNRWRVVDINHINWTLSRPVNRVVYEGHKMSTLFPYFGTLWIHFNCKTRTKINMQETYKV